MFPILTFKIHNTFIKCSLINVLFIRSDLLALYILYFPLFIPRFKVEKRIDKQIISINKIQQHGSRVLNTVF